MLIVASGAYGRAGLGLLAAILAAGAVLVGASRDDAQTQLGHELLIAAFFTVFDIHLTALLTATELGADAWILLVFSLLAAALSIARLLQRRVFRWHFTGTFLAQGLAVIFLIAGLAETGTPALAAFVPGAFLLMVSFLEPARLLGLTLMTWSAVWFLVLIHVEPTAEGRWLLVGLGIVGVWRFATSRSMAKLEHS
jgi:hypothetical protein